MLTKSNFDKEFPEPPQCEVNERDCEFDVEAVCHHCGKPMCRACSIGIGHQPQLIKYAYTNDRGNEVRQQQHCPDCLSNHALNSTVLAGGAGATVLGLILLLVAGSSGLIIVLLALFLMAAGGGMLWNEYRLKVPHNDNYSILDMRP